MCHHNTAYLNEKIIQSFLEVKILHTAELGNFAILGNSGSSVTNYWNATYLGCTVSITEEPAYVLPYLKSL